MTDQSQRLGIAHPTVVPGGDTSEDRADRDPDETADASDDGAHLTVVPGGAD